MPRALSAEEQATVNARKKPLRPTVYDPNTFSSQTVSANFEQWLILAPTQVKQTATTWVKEMLKTEADKDYADLLKQTVDTELSSIETQLTDLSSKTKAFDDWRSEAGLKGFEDVQETAWLIDELQAGFPPFQEEENLKMQQALLRHANDRLQRAALITSKIPKYASSDNGGPKPQPAASGAGPDPAPTDTASENYSEEPKTTFPTAPPSDTTVPAFTWPIAGKPWTRKNSFIALYPSGKQHNALDMGKDGDTVTATAAGRVTLARNTHDARGIACVIDLGNGWEVRHYHLASLAVSAGDQILSGTVIGIVGATGLPKNNPHLHFEVRKNGAPVDPMTLLPGATSTPNLPLAVKPKASAPAGVTENTTTTVYESGTAPYTNEAPTIPTTGESGDIPVERKTRLNAWVSTLSSY